MSKMLDFCKAHGACKDAVDWLTAGGIETMADAWAKCPRADWMLWGLRKLGKLTKRQSVKIAITFAVRALPLFEKRYPGDERPRKAIAAARKWLANPSAKNAAAAYAAAYAADAAAAYAGAAAYAAYAAAAAADADAAAAYADAAAAYAGAAAYAAAYAAARCAEWLWQANYLRKAFPKMFAKGGGR